MSVCCSFFPTSCEYQLVRSSNKKGPCWWVPKGLNCSWNLDRLNYSSLFFCFVFLIMNTPILQKHSHLQDLMNWHNGLLTDSQSRAGTPCHRELGEAGSQPHLRPANLLLLFKRAAAQSIPKPWVWGGSTRPRTDHHLGKIQGTWPSAVHPTAQYLLSRDAREKLTFLTRNPMIQGERVHLTECKEGKSDGSRRENPENQAAAKHKAPLFCLQLFVLARLQGYPQIRRGHVSVTWGSSEAALYVMLGKPRLCSQSCELPAVGRNRALPCSARPKALPVLGAEAWCLSLPLVSSLQGRDLAVEEAPFFLAEALPEGCVSSGAAFATQVAPRAPHDLLQPKGRAPPLPIARLAERVIRQSQSPHPLLRHGNASPSWWKTYRKKSKLFFWAWCVRKLKIKPSKGSFKGKKGGKENTKFSTVEKKIVKRYKRISLYLHWPVPRKRWNCNSSNRSDKESCFYFSLRPGSR